MSAASLPAHPKLKARATLVQAGRWRDVVAAARVALCEVLAQLDAAKGNPPATQEVIGDVAALYRITIAAVDDLRKT